MVVEFFLERRRWTARGVDTVLAAAAASGRVCIILDASIKAEINSRCPEDFLAAGN
ncbi:hypothetical protein BC826DRAFT_1064724 [Russula brevipes]|nr:hypothetical protein BC826DRAFT_1064724 [Russula brevipes]